MARVPAPPPGASRPRRRGARGPSARPGRRRSPRRAWPGTKRSWSRSSAWAASTRCRASSRASTRSGCGSSSSSPPTTAGESHAARTRTETSSSCAWPSPRRSPSRCRRCSAPSARMKNCRPFYARNVSLFVLPLLTGLLRLEAPAGRCRRCAGWRCRSRPRPSFANVFRLQHGQRHPDADRAAPADRAVAGRRHRLRRGRWFAGGGRMDFVRFSGELFIYYVLIALGGGVLTAFTMMMFKAIGMNAEWLVAGLADPVRRDGGRHRRLVAGRGQAERHREHGARADAAVHAAVHDAAAGVSGDDGVDRAARSTSSGRC